MFDSSHTSNELSGDIKAYKTPRNLLTAALILRLKLSRRGPRTVVCLYSGRFAVLGYLLTLFRADRKLLLYVAGSDANQDFGAGLRSLVKRWVRRWVYEHADVVLTNGRHLANRVQVVAPKTKPKVWYHGIETPEVPLRLETPSSLRIFAPRPWGDVYNNGYLLDALKTIGDEISLPIELIMNCKHATPSDLFRIQQLKGTVRVSTVDGYPFSDRYSYFCSATHVVSMSRSDGVPNAVLEAAYAGCGLVLSDIPANRELTSEFDLRAILVRLDSPKDLVSALTKCWTGRDEFIMSASHNMEQVRSKCSIEAGLNVLRTTFNSTL